MPFKLKLKKSRQYNVTSKDLFVIPVHHLLVLDTPTTVDCTLSSVNTGQECLENVCQRLSINQPEFFGLRYLVKGSGSNGNEEHMRWIDLERPLSRQMEKYSTENKLFLRVMYYVVSGVSLINDEVTRNYYFLQLKSDIVDGRICCDQEQAVYLAKYFRHAQYDSHESERHTVDYLKTLLPFPKHLIQAGFLEKLTKEVLKPDKHIQNLTQSAAEAEFISVCQQLDGYGQEKFAAKDSEGNEVLLGVTVAGIAVTKHATKFFPWRDIGNVVNHKRTFNIECTDEVKSVGFTLPDAESGRYFWRLCVLQHTFYMKYEQANLLSVEETIGSDTKRETISGSSDHLMVERLSGRIRNNSVDIGQASNEHGIVDALLSSHIQTNLNQPHLPSNNSIPQSLFSREMSTQSNSNWGLTTGDVIKNQPQSSSCLDLSNNNVQKDVERLKALLPCYRPTPDYDTAIQQKYHASESRLNKKMTLIAQTPQILSDPQINVYNGSQQDIHHSAAVTDAIFGQQLQQTYPDVTQIANPLYQHINHDLFLRPSQIMQVGGKPPPPYPANRLSSTSTPDLALASHRALINPHGAYVSGSSPDLVSSRTFINYPPYMVQQYLKANAAPLQYRYSGFIPHGTYENLNFVEMKPSKSELFEREPRIVDGFKPSIGIMSQSSDTLYPGNHSQQQQIVHDTSEPIYENVPLPWPPNGNEMRDRASSIQSAPGVIHIRQKAQPQQTQKPHMGPREIDTLPPIPNEFPGKGGTASPRILNHPLPTNQSVSDTDKIEIIGVRKSGEETVVQDKKQSMQPFLSHKKAGSVEPQPNQLRPPSQFPDWPKTKSQNNNLKSGNSFSSDCLDQSTSYQWDTSSSSMRTNSTNITADSGVSVATKEKKKKRWNIFTSSKSSLSSKEKSATLGREHERNQKNTTASDENILRHRWSTGLPKLQPLPATMSKEKLCQILEMKLSDPQLYIEYERIPKRKDLARYDVALHEDNRLKNYDPNFLPYDDNRVRLTPTRDNRLGYVNASHIMATVGSKQQFYIIAQSPRDPLTLKIFWQCVWEADVYLVTQFSDEINYIPTTNEKCFEYGQFQIWQEFSQQSDVCITSKLRIYHIQNRRYRSIWHLTYLDWNEQNCPRNVTHFLDFIGELNSVRLASINEVPPGHNTNPPILLHCSEGGGRSGVTLVTNLLLYTMDHNQDLDIPRVVGQLRQQRDNLIPSLAQYKFIYNLLINYIKRSRLI